MYMYIVYIHSHSIQGLTEGIYSVYMYMAVIYKCALCVFLALVPVTYTNSVFDTVTEHIRPAYVYILLSCCNDDVSECLCTLSQPILHKNLILSTCKCSPV